MENKYFGCINPKDIENFDIEQLSKLIFDKGLFSQIYSSTDLKETDEIGVLKAQIIISDDNLRYIFKRELAETVYEFLLKHYSRGVGADLALFNRDFDNETFGLSKKEKRQKALIHFDKLFKLAIGDRSIGFEYNSQREIVAEKRFRTLYKRRYDFIEKLREIDILVLFYITGQINKFDKDLFDSNELIKNIFSFENYLSILISLNNKFKFEEENFFSPKSIAQKIFEKYQNEFDSLRQVEFIDYQINQKQLNPSRAFIICLFDFLKNGINFKMPAAKTFGEIINQNYDLSIGEVKPVTYDNLSEFQLKEYKMLQKDWKDFKN